MRTGGVRVCAERTRAVFEMTATPGAVRATRTPARRGRPPRYKLAVVTWLCVYPMITVILASFKPLGLMALPLPVRTLLLTLVMVPAVSFVLAPLVSRALARWLRR
jgi:antibiotic biosynthesis monooxygenase (ABM) superfamily enzyme